VLEFEIDAADTPRLLRLAAFTARRQGRAKSASVQMIWHDTPAGELARHGLAVAEQRGAWRLERLVPNGVADWLPAAPAPVLAESSHPALLGEAVPSGLMPVAGFTGRQRQFALADATGAARLTILEGALRGLTAEKPACRLTLAGDARGMAAFAAELAADIRLAVPRAGLAASAAALAQGRDIGARHLGGPSVLPGMNVDDALIQVTAHLADVILHWAPLTRPDHGPEPVHQMRVAVRRLRSALSVFRRAADVPACTGLSAALKTLAARLGRARDWDVFLAGTGAAVRHAFPGDVRIAALLTGALRKRQSAYADLIAFMGGRDWQDFALDLALLPTRRPWLTDQPPECAAQLNAPIEGYAAKALDRRLKHVRAPGPDLTGLAPEALHDVRKQAKRLRYASEIFCLLFPGKATRRFLGRMEDVQEALGKVNDAAVAAALMAELGSSGADRAFASGVVQGFVAGSSKSCMAEVACVWKKFVHAEPFWG
jgi:CHAD domain-containing protein